MRNTTILCALLIALGCNDSTISNNANVTIATVNKIVIAPKVDSAKPKQQIKTAYKNFKEALLNADKVDSLLLVPNSFEDHMETKHLPSDIGKFNNLKVLEIHCFSNLEDLPQEIGNLTSLETLNMDEGNGCQMNVSLPSSIGQLTNLKVLNLDGALDYTYSKDDTGHISKEQYKVKKLPQSIANLQNLEELDLERNGLKSVPPQVYSLKKLKILRLDYNNDIHEISDSISNLTNLKELSIILGPSVKLPESMKAFKGLKINLFEDPFKSPDQNELARRKKLQDEFPNIVFSYFAPD